MCTWSFCDGINHLLLDEKLITYFKNKVQYQSKNEYGDEKGVIVYKTCIIAHVKKLAYSFLTFLFLLLHASLPLTTTNAPEANHPRIMHTNELNKKNLIEVLMQSWLLRQTPLPERY